MGANDTGQGTHFRVRIASTRFLGLSRVAQHRLVYDSLRSFTDAGLHALAIEVLPSAHP
jgi:BolA protein